MEHPPPPDSNQQWFGPGAQLNHAGLAVKSIETWPDHGPVVHDPIQKVRVAFVRLHEAVVELVEPASEDSPVNGVLKRGPGVYHLCYQVPNLESAVAQAAKHGFRMLGQPAPAVAFGGRPIAWLYHVHFGLFELVQAASDGGSGKNVRAPNPEAEQVDLHPPLR